MINDAKRDSFLVFVVFTIGNLGALKKLAAPTEREPKIEILLSTLVIVKSAVLLIGEPVLRIYSTAKIVPFT